VRTRGSAWLVAVGVFAVSASAEPAPTSCNFAPYVSVSHSSNTLVPDGGTLVLGPVTFARQGGLTIQDVVVGLRMEHASVGDLVVSLMRVQGAGILSVDLLQRPGFPQSPVGCPSSLGSLEPTSEWNFADDGSGPMGEGASWTPGGLIPEGCYRVAPESPWNLSVFEGLEVGGSASEPAQWYLVVRDDQPGNTGFVHGWTVYLRDQPAVSVGVETWGIVKSLYLD